MFSYINEKTMIKKKKTIFIKKKKKTNGAEKKETPHMKQQITTLISSKKNLSKKFLIKDIIKKKQLKGQYKIEIKDGNENLFNKVVRIEGNMNKWFGEQLGSHIFHSDYASGTMLWNDNSNPKKFIFTKMNKVKAKKTVKKQKYLDGLSHCFFTPVLDWAEKALSECQNKNATRNYTSVINKIVGKPKRNDKTIRGVGLLEIYKAGIPQDAIQDVCDALCIDVDIVLPFCKEKLASFTCKNGSRKKKFNFTNTRLDHLSDKLFDKVYTNDLFTAQEVTHSEMQLLENELKRNKEVYLSQKNSCMTTFLKTEHGNFTVGVEYRKYINEFETDSKLNNPAVWIDGLKYKELTEFLRCGTHYAGTVDFTPKRPTIRHEIDHIKSYTQFKKCQFYNGFVNVISHFRKVTNYDEKGLYFIDNLDFRGADKKFCVLEKKLNCFDNCNIYPDQMLHMLNHFGVTFDVLYGAYGRRVDWEFSDDMRNNKASMNNGDSKVSLYSLWTGSCGRISHENSFYMSGTKDYFENLKANVDIDMSYDLTNKEARITYEKPTVRHRCHLAAQVTSFSQINIIMQLMEMDLDKVIRVCGDGVIYEPHDFEMLDGWRDPLTETHKKKHSFLNEAGDSFISSVLEERCLEGDDGVLPLDTTERAFYKTEIFTGAGGCGKTYYNMEDKGLINTLFVAPSWRLATEKQEQYPHIDCNVYHNIFNDTNKIISKYANIIVDEASMRTTFETKKLCSEAIGCLIYCGDIGFQLPPITIKGERKAKELNVSSFDNHIHLTVNHRCECEKLDRVLLYIRKCISNYITFDEIKLEMIKKFGIKMGTSDEYDYKKDIILCNKHVYCDEHTEKFKDQQKYKCLEKKNGYCNGSIVFDEKPECDSEIRHGYTIDSVQGITCEGTVYIDIRGMSGRGMRALYTAVSRARTWKQIVCI